MFGTVSGRLYDLVYVARDPRVAGLGLAAIRDAVAFFRYEGVDRAGAVNPLAGASEAAFVFGISQSGRVGHHLIYEGLNADERGRIVFDGALLHGAGAGKGHFNHRFRLSTDFGSPHEGHLSGSEFFPMAPVEVVDPVTGERGDTLARARASGRPLKIIFTQSSTEYWCRGASLLHTDLEGRRDLELPPEVRVYLVAGSQHLGGGPHTPGIAQQPRNILDDRWPILRAMLLALDAWATRGVEPPRNRHPRIDDGTLVPVERFSERFPRYPRRQPARLLLPAAAAGLRSALLCGGRCRRHSALDGLALHRPGSACGCRRQ